MSQPKSLIDRLSVKPNSKVKVLDVKDLWKQLKERGADITNKSRAAAKKNLNLFQRRIKQI